MKHYLVFVTAVLMVVLTLVVSACSQQDTAPIQASAPVAQAAQVIGVDPTVSTQVVEQPQNVIAAHPIATAAIVGTAAYMIGKRHARRQARYYQAAPTYTHVYHPYYRPTHKVMVVHHYH